MRSSRSSLLRLSSLTRRLPPLGFYQSITELESLSTGKRISSAGCLKKRCSRLGASSSATLSLLSQRNFIDQNGSIRASHLSPASLSHQLLFIPLAQKPLRSRWRRRDTSRERRCDVLSSVVWSSLFGSVWICSALFLFCSLRTRPLYLLRFRRSMLYLSQGRRYWTKRRRAFNRDRSSRVPELSSIHSFPPTSTPSPSSFFPDQPRTTSLPSEGFISMDPVNGEHFSLRREGKGGEHLSSC